MCEINAVFLHAMRAPHRCGIFPSCRPEKKSPVKLVCVGLRNGQAGVRVSNEHCWLMLKLTARGQFFLFNLKGLAVFHFPAGKNSRSEEECVAGENFVF